MLNGSAPLAGDEVQRESRLTVPWGITEALGSILMAFGIYLVGGNLLSLVAYGLYKHSTHVFDYVAYQFLAMGVITSALVLILRKYRVGPSILGFHFPGWSALRNAAVSVMPIFLGVALLQLIFKVLLPGYHIQGNAHQLLPSTHHGHAPIFEQAALLLFASVEVPLVEETLFRGILFQGMRTFFARWFSYHASVAAAAVASGALFGLVHPEPHSWPILIFIGIALAYVFQYSRSVYASALVHGIINSIAVLAVLNGA
ncbi:MAG: hypothetical protein NVSMB52_04040 [Chloroflexota bacterium]